MGIPKEKATRRDILLRRMMNLEVRARDCRNSWQNSNRYETRDFLR